MRSTFIPIQGTFDIAHARASLRVHMAAQHWSTRFCARATIAITALGELIIAAEHGGVATVRVSIHEGTKPGVELSCVVRLRSSNEHRLEQAIATFDRTVDLLRAEERNGILYITSRMYLEGKSDALPQL